MASWKIIILYRTYIFKPIFFPLVMLPIPSMYGIFTYIWLTFMVNVGKYTIHGWCGLVFRWLFFSKRKPTNNGKNTKKKTCLVILVFRCMDVRLKGKPTTRIALPPLKTNLTVWKITMFNRKYIFIHDGFSIVMLVLYVYKVQYLHFLRYVKLLVKKLFFILSIQPCYCDWLAS